MLNFDKNVQDSDWYESIAKEIQGATCHPVSVRAKYDAQKQIDAINELIKWIN